MSASSPPVRLDPEITASARSAAARMSRSLAEQLSHWARIGRELERSPEVSVVDVQRALSGRAGYDAISAKAQAVVRAVWTERMKTIRDALRLDQDFKAGAYRYAELDERGRVVIRQPAKAGVKARTKTRKRA